ncbi:hypothetical protein [Caballeronia choica]|uniref:hypothetical protein n=1 Tax=Caballeronia choica TaxID=326476 RepID=UPI00190EF09C|nr:hypothetical protein [Caballeronia choica]
MSVYRAAELSHPTKDSYRMIGVDLGTRYRKLFANRLCKSGTGEIVRLKLYVRADLFEQDVV